MKRVLTMLFTVLLVLFAVPGTVHAAETVTLKVAADKSVVNPGDTIKYTVSIGAVNNLGGLEFQVKVPDGLTLDEESVVIPDGVAETIDSAMEIVKPTSTNGYKWSYSAQCTGYTGSSELVLLTFSCTVNEDSGLGEKEVSLRLETCFDNSLDLNELETNLIPAKTTVEKPRVPVSGITLDKSTLAMKDGETVTLTVTVVPDNADNKNVTWNSNNTAVATVVNGTVTAVKPGTAQITVTTEDGNKTAYCTVTVTCAHTMVKTDAVAATCTEDGNIAYYTCSKCSKIFLDEAGVKEAGDTTIKATGHKVKEDWESDGEAHWKTCENCGSELEKANHSFSWKVDQAATEDETGIKHEECVCGQKRSEGTVIPKLDHVHTGIKHYPAVDATCVSEGSKEYWTCSSVKCAGKYYGDAACQTELADIVVPKNPENHVKDGVWDVDAEKHVRTCVCGAKVEEGAHAYDNAADAYCNVCNYKRYYLVTGGANAVYTLNNAGGLTFVVDGEPALFQSLEVDGAAVAAEHYTLAENSMTITLKADYLNTLSVGTHEIKIIYSDGRIAFTGFRIEEERDDEEDESNYTDASTESKTQNNASGISPKTGDDSHLGLWIGMLLAALTGVTVVGAVTYRREHK